jgi:hypothetical protein
MTAITNALKKDLQPKEEAPDSDKPEAPEE